MLRNIVISIAVCLTANILGVTGLLTQNSVAEGSCRTPPGQLASNLNLPWIISVPEWFISHGSKLYWVQNAEVFLGRQVEDDAELQRMCLKTVWDLNSTTTCYGKSVSQSCSLVPNINNPYASCTVRYADPGTNKRIFADFKKRVVLTDNETYALFVRCTNSRRSYYLATTTPHASFQVLSDVFLKIKLLGFKIKHFTTIRSTNNPYCAQLTWP